MADRIVKIVLRGDVTGLKGALAVAEHSVANTEAAMGRASRTASVHAKALSALGAVAKGTGLAVAGGIGLAVKEAADFNAKMALVQTLSKATAAQMHLLSKAAMNAGTAYGYTATQVADAEAEMIKAGVSLKNIMGGGLKGTLALAAAGQMDVADATTVAASAMTQFQLKGKDIPHVADLLAAGADKALGSVQDLGYALEQSGTTAHQMGLSIEDTTGTLAAFAQAGMIGERGGTTLKQMLLQLAAPTKQAQKLMDEYHLSLYQANGQLKSMPEIAGNVQHAFEHLTPAQRNAALGIIFGTRAIQGANIMMQEGQKGIAGWIRKVNDQGFAAQQASGKLNSLKGDLQKLKAAAENAFIGLGQGAQSPLRGFVEDATGELQKLTRDGSIKRWGDEIGHTLQTVVADAKKYGPEIGHALQTVGGGIKTVVDEFGRLPKGMQQALITGSVAAYGAHKLGVDSLATGAIKGLLKGGGGALGSTLASRAAPVPVYVVNEGFGGAGKGSGPGPVIANGEKAAEGAASKGGWWKNIPLPVLPALGSQVFNTPQEQGYHALKIPKSALGPTRDMGGLSGFVNRGLIADLQAAHKAALMLSQDFKSLPKDVRTQIKTPGLLASVQSVKVLADQYRLTPRQIVTTLATSGVIKSIADVEEAQRTFHLTPKQLVTLVKASGVELSKSEVRDLQRLYHLTPKQVSTLLKAIDNASQTARNLRSIYGGLPRQIVTNIVTNHVDKFERVAGAGAHATGGYISGPGGPTSDSIPAYLSNGEYVVKAAAVAKYGRHMFDRLNAMHFADGGYVNGTLTHKELASALAGIHVTGKSGPKAVAHELDQFRKAIHDAGGVWTKQLAAMGDRVVASSRALDGQKKSLQGAKNAVDDAKTALQNLRQTAHDYRSTVAQSFITSPFGASIQQGNQTVTGLAAFTSMLGQNELQTRLMSEAQSGLVKNRLGHSLLFKDLMASGDYQTAIELSDLSRGQQRQYAQRYARDVQSANRVGQTAMVSVYGQQLATMRADLKDRREHEKRLEAHVKTLTAEVKKLREHVGEDVGSGVAKALKGATSSAQHHASNQPRSHK